MASGRHRRYDINGNVTKRSMLLDSFRMNRVQNLQLSDIISHVVEFATDLDGSKFIQRKLDDVTTHRKDMIFREIQPHMLRLMTDKFGNFVVQKLFEICDEIQRIDLFVLIQNHFMELCLNKYGCRVVQRAIEKLSVQQQIQMINQFSKADIIRLSKDSNGNHVIQKYFRQGESYIKVKFIFVLKIYTILLGIIGKLHGVIRNLLTILTYLRKIPTISFKVPTYLLQIPTIWLKIFPSFMLKINSLQFIGEISIFLLLTGLDFSTVERSIAYFMQRFVRMSCDSMHFTTWKLYSQE